MKKSILRSLLVIGLVSALPISSVASATHTEVKNWDPIEAFLTVEKVEIHEIEAPELSEFELKSIESDCSGKSGPDGAFEPNNQEPITTLPAPTPKPTIPSKPTPSVPGGFDIGTIINYGKEIWKIISENKPVVHIKKASANALPQGVSCWTELQNWNIPQSKAYKVIYTNLFGIDVVSFEFRLHYTYGGQVGEVGQYLANVTVAPMNLEVLWGYTFDAEVEVANVVNLGTHANPLAGMEISMNWKVATVVKEEQTRLIYFVQGNGQHQLFE